MITYSVTVTIDKEIEQDWLLFMRGGHIDAVIATGYFTGYKFRELLAPEPEEGTLTFNIQYFCESMGKLQAYMNTKAPALQAEHTEKFKDRAVAFRTVLQDVV